MAVLNCKVTLTNNFSLEGSILENHKLGMKVLCTVTGGEQSSAFSELYSCSYPVYCMLEHNRFIQKFGNCP
jgi:hypothetical protein